MKFVEFMSERSKVFIDLSQVVCVSQEGNRVCLHLQNQNFEVDDTYENVIRLVKEAKGEGF